jgi:thiol-disulfide isomerase/thioredoxin
MRSSFRVVSAVGFAAALVVACGNEKPPETAAGTKTSSGETKGKSWSFDSFNGAGKCAVATGKVTLVDIWATWCEPCKKSFPKLQELHTKYEGKLAIVAISSDDEKDGIAGFAKTHGAKFPVCWDEKKDVIKKFDPKTMPSSYVLDKKGNIKFTHTGWKDGEEAELEKEIKSLL